MRKIQLKFIFNSTDIILTIDNHLLLGWNNNQVAFSNSCLDFPRSDEYLDILKTVIDDHYEIVKFTGSYLGDDGIWVWKYYLGDITDYFRNHLGM
jgi:hypothetical protein